MKRYLVTALLFMFCSCIVAYSQFEYYKPDTTFNRHKAGDFAVSLSPNVLLRTPNGVQIAGGVKVQVFISKRFSLDGDLVFSRDYIHAGTGLIGIPLGILALSSWTTSETLNDSFTGLVVGVVGIVLGFEHISYHIPVNNNLDIAPYVSFLRFKSAYQYDNYSDTTYIAEQMSFASGIQINKYFGRFILAPYAEYNIGYQDHIPGYNFGIYFGYYFKSRRQ